jgi:hypothetical protein
MSTIYIFAFDSANDSEHDDSSRSPKRERKREREGGRGRVVTVNCTRAHTVNVNRSPCIEQSDRA